jgi:thiol-disulfide isomerase/thioredoxin
VAAIGAALLLAAFIAGIARALSQGRQPDCHCFGQIHSEPAGRPTLIRNGVLLAAAIAVAAYGSGPAVDDWVNARSAAELAAVGLGVLAVAASLYAWSLRSENKRLHHDFRIAHRAGALGGRFGLPVGTEAPRFELSGLQGETVRLTSLLDRGNPVILMFMSPWCGPCSSMLPNVRQWQETLRERLTIAVVSAGTPEQNAQFVEQGIEDVVLQEEMEVADLFSVKGTPSAVVLSRDGLIASALGEMERGIEPLVRLALRQGSNITSVEGSAA